MDRTLAHERRWYTLGVLCLSLVLIGLDNTILNVALPTLVRDLSASTSALQWIVDSYVLVFAGLLLTAGALGDKFGRRRALTAGLVVFGLGSLLSAFAGSSTQLIATRALMGMGAAFVMPSTLSILTNSFTDPKERAKAIAIWAGVSGLGIGLGPVAGGWLLEHFWWGSVFLVNIPFIAIALVLGTFVIPESRDTDAPRLDMVGAGLSIVGLVSLVWTLIEAPHNGWLGSSTLLGFAVAAVVLVAFAAWESKVANPMLDVSFFTNRRFSAGSAAITLVFFALFGSLFLLTQLLQFVLGYSALEAGVRLLPIAVTLMLVAPNSARLVEWLGTKAVVASGMTLVAAGLFAASRLGVESAYWQVAMSMMIMAGGMALVMAPATESIMGSLPPAKAGVGSAVNDTTREVGGALGVAVLGSIASSGYAHSIGKVIDGTAMPASAAHAVKDSLGGALQVAGRIGGQPGAALTDAARHAFVDGMGVTLLIAAGVALLGAVIALAFLPARAEELELDAESMTEELALQAA
ncbi:MAG: drug resistance transporter [Actinomycetia bacterium]|nr:drug resistance transporter [Actinomycetes bacterium]